MKTTHHADPRYLRQVTEICIRFVRPETLANLVPVGILCFLAGIVDQTLLIQFPSPVRALWWLLVQSLLVGRFALAAKEGAFHADLFSAFDYSKLPGYMLRFLTISLFWAFPIGTILFLTLPLEEIRLSGVLEWLIARVYLSGSEPFRPSFSFWVLLLGIAAGVILPMLTAILATMARSPVHAMFPSLWKHPFQDKHSHPILLVVALLGSIATAFFLYLPIIGAFSVLAFHISPTLGSLLASLAIAVPVMSWPIIAGRLAGTWVHFHPLSEEADISDPIDENAIEMPPVIRPTALNLAINVDPATRSRDDKGAMSQDDKGTLMQDGKGTTLQNDNDASQSITLANDATVYPNIDVPLAEIQAILDTDALEAMKRLLPLKTSNPHDARVLGLEVQILLKLNLRPKALSLAIPAVKALFASHYTQDIPAIYTSLGKDRHTLPWESETLDQLARVFLEAKDFKEAGWCAHTCELQTGNVVRAGKRIVQVADAASAARDFDAAVGLLKYYLKHHPDGPFVDYAKKAIHFNQKQGSESHG